MSITKAKKDLLETILGSEISIPSKTIKIEEMISRENILEVVSSDLYNSLSSFFDASAPFFKTSLPLERIVRYRDGTFSSMEKSLKGGISQHEGYEIINSIDIAQQLMSYVMPCLNMKLASLYSDLVNQNTDYLNQIQDSLIIPEVSKLRSISEYLKDVSEEVEHISKSNNLSIATLTNLQQRRIDLKQTFHIFITRLNQSIESTFFDPQNIANSYLIARYALSNYIISLVFECIVSGNLDDSSISKMKNKVENCFNELNDITEKFSHILEQKKFTNAKEINNINSFYVWSYNYMAQIRLNDLHSQNNNINALQNNTLQYFDIAYEMQRLEKFVQARYEFLKRIEVKKG